MKLIALPTGSHVRADQITAVRVAGKSDTILDRVIVDFSVGLHEICYCGSEHEAVALADMIALDITAATEIEWPNDETKGLAAK